MRVGLVDLLDGTSEKVGVEAQAVAEHLDVRDLYIDLALVWVGEVHGAMASVVAQDSGHLGTTAQIDVHRLKEGLPAVSQHQGPVETLRVLEPDLLPAGVPMFTKRHAPSFRVASAEWVDVNKEHGVHAAVPHLTNLHGQAHHHVQVVHTVLVALQCQRHAFAPARVEEGLQAHLVADEGGVDVQARVHLLQQVLQLQVLKVQIRLETDELLATLRVHVLRFAAPTVQLVALVA